DYKSSMGYLALANSTRSVYSSGLDKLEDYFGDEFKLVNMTVREASKYYEYKVLFATGKPSYVSAMMKGPKAAFQTLVDLREAEINPFALINIKLKYNPRAVVWSKEEVEMFYAVAKTHNDLQYMHSFVTMLYESAQRPEDVRSMMWVQRGWSEKYNAYYLDIIQQKTGTAVTVWITEKTDLAICSNRDPLTYTHLFNKKGEHVSLQTFRNDFKKVLDIAGLRPELQMRDLRRSRVTHLIDAGKTSEQVMALTGHKSLSVFEKTYKVTSRDTSAFILQGD
ncbi:MAG: tyrosine-type recombinase/integrase, partial [Nitrosopumilus sp.]